MRGSQIQSACSVMPTCTWFGLGTVGLDLFPCRRREGEKQDLRLCHSKVRPAPSTGCMPTTA